MATMEDQDRIEASDPVRFFDRLSPHYGSRYQGKDRFHQYYFHERMEKAIRGLDLTDGQVLDIGSGTGDLYGVLSAQFPSMQFLASDVSAGMLEHSLVPPGQRLLGRIYEHHLGTLRFDAVFMLGVSTYMDRAELEKNLAFVAGHLKPEGKFVITFTHRHGLDTWMRALAKTVMGRRATGGDNVLSSGMQIHRYGHRDVQELMAPHFRITRWDALNHTIFPFNRFLPKLSIGLAERLSRYMGAPAWLRVLSSDLMVRATLR